MSDIEQIEDELQEISEELKNKNNDSFLMKLAKIVGYLITIATLFSGGFWLNEQLHKEKCSNEQRYLNQLNECKFHTKELRKEVSDLKANQNITSIEMTYAQRLVDYLVTKEQYQKEESDETINRLLGAKKNLIQYIKEICKDNKAKILYSSGTIIINNNMYIIPSSLFMELK